MSNKKKVLIVDDNLAIRMMIREYLCEDSFEVAAEACDGVEAFEKYKRFKPDLVTLDLIMPRESGLDALKKIIDYDPHANVIIVTGLNDRHTLLAVLEAGAKDYVLKPFNGNILLGVARRIAR
jgi:two-component system chemotaxis response regulator CheY